MPKIETSSLGSPGGLLTESKNQGLLPAEEFATNLILKEITEEENARRYAVRSEVAHLFGVEAVNLIAVEASGVKVANCHRPSLGKHHGTQWHGVMVRAHIQREEDGNLWEEKRHQVLFGPDTAGNEAKNPAFSPVVLEEMNRQIIEQKASHTIDFFEPGTNITPERIYIGAEFRRMASVAIGPIET